MGAGYSNLVKNYYNDESETELHPDQYHPSSENEVLHVQQTMMNFVPVELADLIVDYAQYWPRLASCREANPPITINSTSGSGGVLNDAYQFYLVTDRPIPEWSDSNLKVVRKVRKVVFRIWSHDQGWGGDDGLVGNYEGSWTWFEAAIWRGEEQPFLVHRPESSNLSVPATHQDDLNPDTSKVWHLQSNIRASAKEAFHEVVWTDVEDWTVNSWGETGSGDGRGFVRLLQPGDKIAVIARARYPGWVNHVRRVEVEIFYSL
ncbi:uncharacterized protein LACBIDRAFT_313370 [Laccaria bicolor S238N-H82]|uniref:Predicted protein n=1 Tax=Laccaria bicolor (strain S238N-H82 / ATCC MYA-4686) TaxID=486041 RepID=B0DY64_LACBS|nr:uncharacterized protein LACBIDRAFT_313370 [Laccaria bicolor S238N-H82]EDR00465.1 predicted protein [Laccaria bicolor S238N-H82]|eukprot:XP_001888857.1 predicted protein [Laccaria bicolor S238N-H82]